MGASRILGGVTATATFVMTCAPAFADVTSQQVWEDWKAYLGGFGYSVQADEAADGGDLTVSDIVLDMPLPEAEGDLTISVPEVSFTDNGNGTVSVSFPSPLPILIQGSGKEGSGAVTLDYTTTGYSMVVSGDVDAMTYVYEADTMAVTLEDVMEDGEMEEVGDARFELTDVSGQSEMRVGDLRQATQEFTSGPISYMLDFEDPENGDRMQMNGEAESLSVTAETAMPPVTDMSDLNAALAAGFAVDAEYAFGPGNTSIDVDQKSGGEAFKATTTSNGGTLSVAMDESQLGYGIAYQGLEMEMASSDLPFPVELAFEQLGLDLMMPVSQSEEPQNFKLDLLLADFTMSDFIWGMFDPQGTLPRDPATVAVDLSGQATLNTDLMDPEAMVSADIPGEVNEVALNDLRVSFAGAELTGSGDVELDNSDMSSYDGMPKPVGTVNLALEGGNALLDKLVSLGLVPEEQAMGARMMMGMFAVPSGEDNLTSTIEFTEEGQVLANGQRLK